MTYFIMSLSIVSMTHINFGLHINLSGDLIMILTPMPNYPTSRFAKKMTASPKLWVCYNTACAWLLMLELG